MSDTSGPDLNGHYHVPPTDVIAVRLPIRKRERVDLTGDYAGLWVDLHTNPSLPDNAHWLGDEGTLTGLAHAILEWNIGDPASGPWPITVETIRQLPMALIRQLVEAYQERALGLPKGTTLSSSTTTTASPSTSPPGSPSPKLLNGSG